MTTTTATPTPDWVELPDSPPLAPRAEEVPDAPEGQADAAPPGPGPDDPAARSSSPRSRRRLLVPGLTVALSLAAGAAGGLIFDDDAAMTTGATAQTQAAPQSRSTDFAGQALDVAGALARVQQAVASIDTKVQTRRGPFVSRGEGAGTGVVIDSDGYILTNAHVVDGATSIEVTLSGESKRREATVVASDATSDIAVLHVDDTEGLVAADIADAHPTRVGDQVIAIGNALSLEGGLTVTQGIVSALDRSIDTERGTLTDLIQTDAAISSGNSGGPLVNADGEVVGINTAVAGSYGGVQATNIGFAISIDKALAVAESLLSRTA